MFGKFNTNASRVKDSLPESHLDGAEKTAGFPSTHLVSGLRERRLLISLRAVSIALVASLILSMVLTLTIFSMLPLREVRPFLVRIVDEGSVVAAIRPIPDTFDAMDLLTEQLVRQYVVVRSEILRSDAIMQDRWGANGLLRMTTSDQEYQRFVRQVSPQLEQIRRNNGEIRVSIVGVNPVRTGQVYIVDFRTTSRDAGDRVVDERVFTVTMEIRFRNIRGLSRREALINPTGFTVMNFTVSERER